MDGNIKPSVTFESTSTRRLIIASYWIVILFAVPLWWRTTSIQREALPVSRVFAQTHKDLVFPVHVYLDASKTDWNGAVIAAEVQGHLEGDADFRESGLRVQVSPGNASPDGYQVVLAVGSRDPVIEGRRLTMEISPEHMSTVHMQIADTLATLLAPYTTLRSSQAERVAKYAPRYRLAFTLLNEDGASGNAALSWDVRTGLHEQLSPLLERVSMLHNFTIESQIQVHAPLAFEPRALYIDGRTEYGVTSEDLTVFINSAEWTLSSSVSNDPVLHFVAFIPSSRHAPLRILDENGYPTSSKAFILPQWGGIVIYNPATTGMIQKLSGRPLNRIFATFHQQLAALLGVPMLPPHIHAETRGPAGVTGWQLDALVRRRAVENCAGAQDTLQSIVRLVAQIEGMPVGEDVRGDVQDALAALDQAYTIASSSEVWALAHAGKAHSAASRAFFNPGMLALLYFPTEHKYAVYAPLFASVTAPLLAAVIREALAWRKDRKSTMRVAQVRPMSDQKME